MCKEHALFLYSKASGRGKKFAKIDEIEAKLSAHFNLDCHECFSLEEGLNIVKKEASSYDVLLLFGGDGTLQHYVNALCKLENPPKIGYLRGGTLNDGGKNFGARTLNKSIKIILQCHVEEIDVLHTSGETGIYLLAGGAFTDVSYVSKKKLGFWSYYLRCIKLLFKKQRHEFLIRYGDQEIKMTKPFISIANGKWIGGFLVNRKSSITDGLLELIVPRWNFLNGVPALFFNIKRIIKAPSFHIETDPSFQWSLDGEKSVQGSIDVSVAPKKLKFYSAVKSKNR